MSNLLQFLKSIKNDKRLETFDEAATKQAVVLRILSSIGWNTFDIDEVQPEYSVMNTRVDFSLRLNHANKVFIEVKKISEDLDKHQEQLLNYSFQEGVKLAILTNGISWWFYLPLNEGSWEQRKFYTIDLLQQKPEDILKKFDDLLSKDNISTGAAIKNAETIFRGRQKKFVAKNTIPEAWKQIITEPDELLVETIIETVEKMSGFRVDSELVENFLAENVNTFTLNAVSSNNVVRKPVRRNKITKSKNFTGMTITSFYFDGSNYEVESWREMLLKLVDELSQKRDFEFEKVLTLVGRKRPYFTREKNELRKPHKISETDIFVEINLSSNQIFKICSNLISLFGYTKADYSVKTEMI